MIAKTKWGRSVEVIACVVALFAIPNFLSMMIAESYIGGGAFNGYTLDGHFFVGSHGHYKEVSHETYVYSWWHNLAVVINYIFLFTVAIIEIIRDRRHSTRSKAVNPGADEYDKH